MARQIAFAALLLAILAGAQARVLQQGNSAIQLEIYFWVSAQLVNAQQARQIDGHPNKSTDAVSSPAALAPQMILAPPPTEPYDPKVLPPKSDGKTLGDLTGVKSLPPCESAGLTSDSATTWPVREGSTDCLCLGAVGSFIFPNGTICQNSGIGNIGCSNNGNFNLG